MDTQTRIQRTRNAAHQRREQHKEELRQLILDAAAELLLVHGYDRFSLRQVAEQIGYTPTTIYLYFQDKADLLFAVVDSAYADFSSRLQAAYASVDDPLQRIRALGQAYIDFGLANPVVYQLIFVQRPDFLLTWRQGEAQPRASALLVLQRAVDEAQRAGGVRSSDVQQLADALWAMVHGLVSLAIGMPMFDAARSRAAAATALDLMIDALRA